MPGIVEGYVQDYNAARRANDIDKAKYFGGLAVKEADNELKKPNLSNDMRSYCQNIKSQIEPFLKNPNAKPVSRGTADTEKKIKSTDWFAGAIPSLKINDIAGLEDVKNAFTVNIFAPTDPKYSDIYKKYRGEEYGLQVLLYGPPGTGKTYAVKCLAGQMQCQIAVVQIKDVMASLVGDGAKIISEIFEQAKKYDRCIIFFDEIDAIASSRESDDSRHTKEQLTTLLTNMDGFTSKANPNQVRIVIAATNRPWALDSAVKRGGRFDTQIYVPLPDDEARKVLIERALKTAPVEQKDETIKWLITCTKGYSGADIQAICKQAIARPLKREILARHKGNDVSDCVKKKDFEYVLDRYINPTNEEDLMRFDAYTMNMDYDNRDYKVLKCKQIDAMIRKGQLPEEYEENWLKFLYSKNETGLVSFDMLMRLDAVKNNKAYDDFYKKQKCEAILLSLKNKELVEDYERDWFKDMYRRGLVDKYFAKLYDLSFLSDEFYFDNTLF